MNIIETGEGLLRQNAGRIIKPEQYEFHWEVEFKNGQVVKMFDEYTRIKRFFPDVVENKDVLFAIWRGVRNDTVHFGVTMEKDLPVFMVCGKLVQPMHPAYFRGHNFKPDLRITNTIAVKGNQYGPDLRSLGESNFNDREMDYKAGFTFTFGTKEHKMYISWNGASCNPVGFDSFKIVGEYKIL